MTKNGDESHMAYATDFMAGQDNGVQGTCPKSHPYKVPRLFYEVMVSRAMLQTARLRDMPILTASAVQDFRRGDAPGRGHESAAALCIIDWRCHRSEWLFVESRPACQYG